MAGWADDLNGVTEIFVLFFFYSAVSTASFMCEREREREWQTPLHAREKERENFETCLVSLFLVVGSPPILAVLVGSQQHKLPPASSLR
jgi:hypothetical protein